MTNVADSPSKNVLSLNIDRQYNPQWGAREGIREAWANWRDAGGGTIDIPNPDVLVFRSPTSPSLSELTVIGRSGKRGKDTIGQFGEGCKVGANAILRCGGTISVATPEGKVTYMHEIPKGLDCSILHAVVDGSEKLSEGSEVTIQVPRAQEMLGEIKTEEPLGPIPKLRASDPCRIFCKGVFVQELPEDTKSIFHWNLDFPLNRDRLAANPYEIPYYIARHLMSKLDENSFLDLAVDKPDMYESYCFRNFCPSYMTPGKKQIMENALTLRYGEKWVISSGEAPKDQVAISRGFVVPQMHSDLVSALKRESMRSAADETVVPKSHGLTSMGESCPQLKKALKITELLEIRLPISVYDASVHKDRQPCIIARGDGGYEQIWMSSDLFKPGVGIPKMMEALCRECALWLMKNRWSVERQMNLDESLAMVAGILADKVVHSRN